MSKYFYDSLYIYAYMHHTYIIYVKKKIKIIKNHEIYNKKIHISYLTKHDHNNLKNIENIIIYNNLKYI